jgi:hypothetical protein
MKVKTLSARTYSVKHVNLTKFDVIIIRPSWTDKHSDLTKVIPNPSQAFLRADGTVTVQSRTTGLTVKAQSLRLRTVLGVKGDKLVEIKFAS